MDDIVLRATKERASGDAAVQVGEYVTLRVDSRIDVLLSLLRRVAGDLTPEQRLWLAIIERAIRDLYRSDLVLHSESAQQYIAGRRFDHDCEMAGIDAAWAREAIATIGDLDANR